ncbi:MAG TPA: hypothetical protein VNA57_08070 [Acidimicrobiales bacterium]|nr:hypothetical protein [Acidimicrobiales bacterium]
MSIEHVPSAKGVAGDELGVAADLTSSCAATAVCTQPTLTAHYVDVEQQEKSVVGSADGVSNQLTVAIPGKDVRFPSVSYWLEASVVERPVGVTEETCSVQPSVCRLLTARSPATGMHTTQVDNVVRLGFQRPDGTPAAGVRVLAMPPRSGKVWKAGTDANGMMQLVIPSDDPYIVERQAEPGYTNLFLRAFDGPPPPAVPDGETVQVAGNGADVGVIVNLGSAAFDAVQAETQDEVFALRPEEATFTSASSSDSSCPTGIDGELCVTLEEDEDAELMDVREPVSTKVGGGVGMTSKVIYTSSAQSTQTFAVKSGASWAEAGGEVTADDEWTAVADPKVRGPNENYTYRIGMQHVRTRFSVCEFRGIAGLFGQASCEEREAITPKRWLGALVGDASPGKHDLATKQTATPGSDCVMPVENKWTSTVAKSHKMGFDLQIGPEIVGLKTTVRYTNSTDNSKKFTHEWSVVTGSTRPFHHLYVPKGIADGDTEKHKCPFTHPSLAWTDSADYDKTLSASAAANVPTISPAAQVTDSTGRASWIVKVLKDVARQTTLRFDFGDGTHEDRAIPQGSGESSFSFSHTFSGTSQATTADAGSDSLTSSEASSTPSGTGTYGQSVTSSASHSVMASSVTVVH